MKELSGSNSHLKDAADWAWGEMYLAMSLGGFSALQLNG